MEEYKVAKQVGDNDRQQILMQEISGIYSQHKVHPLSPFATSLISAPVFISFFLALRDMSALEFMREGGTLWFPDLTAADPYFILPVAAGLSFLTVVEKGMDVETAQPQSKFMKNIFRVMAVGSVPLMATFPAALSLYWVTNNLCTMVLTMSLRVPTVRRMLSIPALPGNVTESTATKPASMGFWQGFQLGKEMAQKDQQSQTPIKNKKQIQQALARHTQLKQQPPKYEASTQSEQQQGRQ